MVGPWLIGRVWQWYGIEDVIPQLHHQEFKFHRVCLLGVLAVIFIEHMFGPGGGNLTYRKNRWVGRAIDTFHLSNICSGGCVRGIQGVFSCQHYGRQQ